MSKHLKPTDISAIVELIRGWTGNKLTWELVCDVVAPLIQDTTTRQTLNSHPEIKSAFALVNLHQHRKRLAPLGA